jgi:hypothetical protein
MNSEFLKTGLGIAAPMAALALYEQICAMQLNQVLCI